MVENPTILFLTTNSDTQTDRILCSSVKRQTVHIQYISKRQLFSLVNSTKTSPKMTASKYMQNNLSISFEIWKLLHQNYDQILVTSVMIIMNFKIMLVNSAKISATNYKCKLCFGLNNSKEYIYNKRKMNILYFPIGRLEIQLDRIYLRKSTGRLGHAALFLLGPGPQSCACPPEVVWQTRVREGQVQNDHCPH